MKVIFQVESPESTEALAHFMTFVRGSQLQFEKKFGAVAIPVEWVCRDYKGSEYIVKEHVLFPVKAGCKVCGAERVPLSQFCREHQP